MKLLLELWNWLKSWFVKSEEIKPEIIKPDHSAALAYMDRLSKAKRNVSMMGIGINPEQEAIQRFHNRNLELLAKLQQEEQKRLEEEKEKKGI